MAEQSNNAETFEVRSAADETKKLKEDAPSLGPQHVGSFGIGVVDMIVGDDGVEVPEFVATKNETLQLARHWPRKIIRLDFAWSESQNLRYNSTGISKPRSNQEP